ncbi:unnamed protein product [Somion occarium]|uniref:Uncharacterized protein n=1 Tax=Somion occarium TaxID=3059160 RepID=A0ABP1E7X3_9APHY
MLGFLTRSSDRPKSTDAPLAQSNGVKDANVVVDTPSSNGQAETAEKGTSKGEAGKEADPEPKMESQITQDASSQPYTGPTIDTVMTPHSDRSSRRFSWKLPFLSGSARHEAGTPTLSAVAEHDRKRHGRDDFEKYEKNLSRSEKRADESAIIIRTLIVGPSGIVPISAKTKPLSEAKLAKVKSELVRPKSANKGVSCQYSKFAEQDKGAIVNIERLNNLRTTRTQIGAAIGISITRLSIGWRSIVRFCVNAV